MTVYGVATALQRNPDAVAAMREAGWEIACHGLKWIDYRDFSYEEEKAHMSEAIRIHTEVTGERPLGWYTGRTSENTLKLVMEEGGFLYSADSYADDLPYWVEGPAPRSWWCPIPSIRTTCGSPHRKASMRATSSSLTYAIPSTCSTPRAPRRPGCCRSACIAASSAGRAGSRRWPASSTTSPPTTTCG